MHENNCVFYLFLVSWWWSIVTMLLSLQLLAPWIIVFLKFNAIKYAHEMMHIIKGGSQSLVSRLSHSLIQALARNSVNKRNRPNPIVLLGALSLVTIQCLLSSIQITDAHTHRLCSEASTIEQWTMKIARIITQNATSQNIFSYLFWFLVGWCASTVKMYAGEWASWAVGVCLLTLAFIMLVKLYARNEYEI